MTCAKYRKPEFSGEQWPQLEDKSEEWVIEQRTAGRSDFTGPIRLKATVVAGDMKVKDNQGGLRCDLSICTRTTNSQ